MFGFSTSGWNHMHAEQARWVAAVCPVAAKHVGTKDEPFLIEQIRAELADKIEQPIEQRWWGQVTQWLKSQGLIRKEDAAPAKSSNGSLKPTWINPKSFDAQIDASMARVAKTARGG